MDVKTGRTVENTSQLEEMVRARELFFDDPYYVPKEEIEANMEKEALEQDNCKEEKTVEKTDEKVRCEETVKVCEDPVKHDREEVITEQPENEEEIEKNLDAADDFETCETSEEEIKQEKSEVQEEEPEVAKVVFEPENDEPLSASLETEETSNEANEQEVEVEHAEEEKVETEPENPQEDKDDEEDTEPEIARVIIDPSKNNMSTEELAKEFLDGHDEDLKRGKGTKIAIWILSIIIVVVASLLIIRIAMPNTLISRYMDKVASSAISMISGDDKKSSDSAKEEDSVREELLEDKSGLIQLELNKNYKDIIGDIKYNEDAKYDSNKSYTLKDLKDPKEIQTNVWYVDDSGETHYYDQEIIGTIIAYESQRAALLNDGDNAVYNIVAANSGASDKIATEINRKEKIKKFDSLEIGEIKVAGNAYYVWVIETIDGESTLKVYEIKEADQKLQVSDVSEG